MQYILNELIAWYEKGFTDYSGKKLEITTLQKLLNLDFSKAYLLGYEDAKQDKKIKKNKDALVNYILANIN